MAERAERRSPDHDVRQRRRHFLPRGEHQLGANDGRVRRDPVTLAAFGVLGAMIILALGADLLAEHLFHISFSKQDLFHTYRRPVLDDPAWWLGSDLLGRSEVVRLLYGARVSLFIGTF